MVCLCPIKDMFIGDVSICTFLCIWDTSLFLKSDNFLKNYKFKKSALKVIEVRNSKFIIGKVFALDAERDPIMNLKFL